jgi:hypothetical protein
VIPGLWDLAFARGGRKAGEPDHLSFTAGPETASFAGNGLLEVILAPGENA